MVEIDRKRARAIRSKQRYDDLKAMGICVQCAKRARIQGNAMCPICRGKAQKRARDRYVKRKNQQLCHVCGLSPTANGGVYCESCLTHRRNNDRNRRARYRAERRCYMCGNAAEEGRTLCPGCYGRDSTYHRRRPDINRAKRARRRTREAGNKGDASAEQIAARIEYYGGLCYLCGRPYEHIDHVIPVTRGGSNWPANLRPICAEHNRTKGNKVLLEFLPEVA